MQISNLRELDAVGVAYADSASGPGLRWGEVPAAIGEAENTAVTDSGWIDLL